MLTFLFVIIILKGLYNFLYAFTPYTLP